MADFSSYDAGFTAYENGKHRRYGLLFSVNGGALALAKLLPDIAKLLPDGGKLMSDPTRPFLGGLTGHDVALAMIAFTVIMFVDIAAFGRGMRRWAYKTELSKRKWSHWTGSFSLIGLFVLFALCTLICGAWYLVQDPHGLGLIEFSVLSLLFVLCICWYLAREAKMRGDKFWSYLMLNVTH